MAGYAQDIAKKARGGKNALIGVFVTLNSGGTAWEIPASGTDPLGGTYGDAHYLGSLTKSKLDRDESGIPKFTTNIIEQDVKRRNMHLELAPASSGAKDEPELSTEDGTQVAGKNSGSYNTDLPVLIIFYFGAKVGGKNNVHASIMQASRASSVEFDNGQWSTISLELGAIDAKGYLPVAPAGDTNFTGITFAALTGNARFGKWFYQV